MEVKDFKISKPKVLCTKDFKIINDTPVKKGDVLSTGIEKRNEEEIPIILFKGTWLCDLYSKRGENYFEVL